MKNRPSGVGVIKVVTVVGARPQFIKAAAVSRAVASFNQAAGETRIDERIVHTGQHYDENMSKIFFDELQIPRPELNLKVGSGPHGWQTARMLERLEEMLAAEMPDWTLIYGDTNSTLAAALAAAKLHIPVAHVEAGLRSYNRRMPEEINRVVADHVSDLLLCPTNTAVSNLANEGITRGVHKTGDVMYDSVLFNAKLAEKAGDVMARLGLAPRMYLLATVHRAENTDDPERLNSIIEAFKRIDTTIVLPLHPRTRKTLGASLEKLARRVCVIEPVPYLEMLTLEQNARVILTDSGGVQKEAYWFGVPCVTLRGETEWVELVEAGCNRLAGADTAAILDAVHWAEDADLTDAFSAHLYGDGRSAEETVQLLTCPTRPGSG